MDQNHVLPCTSCLSFAELSLVPGSRREESAGESTCVCTVVRLTEQLKSPSVPELTVT